MSSSASPTIWSFCLSERFLGFESSPCRSAKKSQISSNLAVAAWRKASIDPFMGGSPLSLRLCGLLSTADPDMAAGVDHDEVPTRRRFVRLVEIVCGPNNQVERLTRVPAYVLDCEIVVLERSGLECVVRSPVPAIAGRRAFIEIQNDAVADFEHI